MAGTTSERTKVQAMITSPACSTTCRMKPELAGEPRPHSPLWQSPQLKEVIVAAALAGEITEQDAADLFVEYGLKKV